MSKKLHKAHDSFVKTLLSNHDSAVEFLHQALPPEICSQFDLNHITYLSGTYVTKELNDYISDILLKIPVSGTSGEATVSILVEHKSTIDHLTCLQLLTYIANGYDQQRRKKEPFSVIIPVIYYHGKDRWTFRPLHALFQNVPEAFKKFIPTFSTELFQVQQLSIEQIHSIAESKLRAAFMLQKGVHDRLVATMDYVKVMNALEPSAKGNFLFSYFVYMQHFATFDQYTIIDITNQLTTEMKTKTMSFIDQFRKEGREEGIQQGSLRSRYEFARKLILRNMPLNEICELTELSIEEVQTIQKGV